MEHKVLIIDDDPIFTAFLCTLLRDDYEIFTANEGYSSITVAMNVSPDIILLDIVMPGMSGREIAAALAHLPETKKTPIIFITGEASGCSTELPGNVCDCIQKSLKAEKILKKVKEHTPPPPPLKGQKTAFKGITTKKGF